MIQKLSISLALIALSTSALANECPYGKILGLDSADDVYSYPSHRNDKSYTIERAHFIQGTRAEQIKKALQVRTVRAAFEAADENRIYKFEIPGNSHTSYDYLTIVYAYMGDTRVGAVFLDDSTVVAARLSDSDIRVCSAELNR